MPDSPPDCPADFLFETPPILLPNQRTITLLAMTAAKQNTWVYINQPTGTGKTTQMLEIGYLAALKQLSPLTKGQIKVHLIVPSFELATLHEQTFVKK